jgi:hypothetical protein
LETPEKDPDILEPIEKVDVVKNRESLTQDYCNKKVKKKQVSGIRSII